jgi:hypothetical protein
MSETDDKVAQIKTALQEHLVAPVQKRFLRCESRLDKLDTHLRGIERRQWQTLWLLAAVAALLVAVLVLLSMRFAV